MASQRKFSRKLYKTGEKKNFFIYWFQEKKFETPFHLTHAKVKPNARNVRESIHEFLSLSLPSIPIH